MIEFAFVYELGSDDFKPLGDRHPENSCKKIRAGLNRQPKLPSIIPDSHLTNDVRRVRDRNAPRVEVRFRGDSHFRVNRRSHARGYYPVDGRPPDDSRRDLSQVAMGGHRASPPAASDGRPIAHDFPVAGSGEPPDG